ncbi:MAG: hypothetical protein MRZ46_02595, partial [Oscillospiraceae bacterium]|nr:hypothetical protein [Oscillospiraceae bacterium]
ITNSFNNKKIEFGQYNVDVSLELETQTTTAASASADNSMNDEALFNLVSNSEVTDSAGYLTPQGEVSFLGGLEIMNQSAEVRTVANITNNINGFTLKFDNDDNQFNENFDLSKYDYSNVKRIVVVYEKVPTQDLTIKNSSDWEFHADWKFKDKKYESLSNSNGKAFSYEINKNQKLKSSICILNYNYNYDYGSRLSEIQFYYSADEGIKETTAPITTTNTTTTAVNTTDTTKITTNTTDTAKDTTNTTTITSTTTTTTTITTTTKATTVTTTTTTVAVSKSDKPMSSYRMKLTVTVRDKKGKEMYKRSGSISVMNYENSNMKDKRFPKGMILNNTTDSGFVLKIYYID